MKIKTNFKAGGMRMQHNETLVRIAQRRAKLKVNTNLKAGGARLQHNETLVKHRTSSSAK